MFSTIQTKRGGEGEEETIDMAGQMSKKGKSQGKRGERNINIGGSGAREGNPNPGNEGGRGWDFALAHHLSLEGGDKKVHKNEDEGCAHRGRDW